MWNTDQYAADDKRSPPWLLWIYNVAEPKFGFRPVVKPHGARRDETAAIATADESSQDDAVEVTAERASVKSDSPGQLSAASGSS